MWAVNYTLKNGEKTLRAGETEKWAWPESMLLDMRMPPGLGHEGWTTRHRQRGGEQLDWSLAQYGKYRWTWSRLLSTLNAILRNVSLFGGIRHWSFLGCRLIWLYISENSHDNWLTGD